MQQPEQSTYYTVRKCIFTDDVLQNCLYGLLRLNLFVISLFYDSLIKNEKVDKMNQPKRNRSLQGLSAVCLCVLRTITSGSLSYDRETARRVRDFKGVGHFEAEFLMEG